MNKLVSKNPIQRFKQGKKIEKFQLGKNFKRVGTANNGLSGIYFNPDDSKLYKGTLTGYDYIGDSYKYTNYGTGKTGVINASEYIKKPLTGKTNIDVNEELKVLNEINSKSNSTKSGIKTEYKKKLTPRSRWSYGYNRSNEISDIRATQQMLKDAGYLSSDKYNVVDGKWGKDTENAYKKYLLNKEKPIITPTQEKIQQVLPQIAQQAQPTLVTQTLLNQTPTLTNFTPQPVTRTFNRSEIRDYIRSKGKGAYDYTGAQKKALRMVINGQGTDEDKAIVKDMGLFKQGGQLISRNPVKRFKQKNFRLVAQ